MTEKESLDRVRAMIATEQKQPYYRLAMMLRALAMVELRSDPRVWK